MKKFNGFFAMLCVFALICVTSIANPAEAEQVLTCSHIVISGQEGEAALYDYVLLADQSARIVKCHDASLFDAVPEALDGHVVSEIGEHAYSRSCVPSMYLFIPDCVTTVRQNAFGDVFTKLTLEISATHPTLKEENGRSLARTA